MASPYGPGTLPQGIRSRIIPDVNGLNVHILESGFDVENPDRPLALLLHGFPDLAYGWRHVMPLLADAGYYVVAPDQRGCGQTTGWVNEYDTPLAPFGLLNSVSDATALVSALGYKRTDLLVGHDQGSPIAAYCALIRPDMFTSVALMSAPFPGPPSFPFNTANPKSSSRAPAPAGPDFAKLAIALASLTPPRMLYQQYLAGPDANQHLSNPTEGLRRFLRTFYHVKSGDWEGNTPRPITTPTPQAFAEIPSYYIMERGKTMPENVAQFEPTPEDISKCHWLTDTELGVYVSEYSRTGFQGGLQSYRVHTNPELTAGLKLFSGRTIDVPSIFIGGSKDWATYISPGALQLMRDKATTKMLGTEMIDGAGHWIQQEKPAELVKCLLAFAQKVSDGVGVYMSAI